VAARRARWWFDLPGLPRWRRRVKHLLVMAFLFVTVPPLVGMTLFSRTMLASALPQSATTHQLETLEMLRGLVQVEVRETVDVTAMPEGAPKGLTDAKVRAHFNDDWCRSRAAAIGHDIHLFDRAGRLASSSRRDLFTAGLLDLQLPGRVARALLVEGRTAAVEPSRVGRDEFRTGYRVMRDAVGDPVLVMAMPTQALQRDAASLLAKTLTLIYAMALTALLAVGAIAMLLARRLSRPMERLTGVTRQIAAGNLDVRIGTTRTDELGDLERAFDQMTGELQESRERLIAAEKESAWREMAQQIAHEVKNPLTPLKLSAQHLQRAYRDGADNFDQILADATRRIIDQVEALRKVAGRFSAFAGKSTRELRQVDVNALVREAVALYDTPEARHTFATDCSPVLPPVMADADDLRRVLINLVTNALQAMEQGGTLTVRTVRSKNPAPPEPRKGDTNRRVRARETDRPAGWVGIEVRDNGPGIPPEVQERLFEPYFSTKTSGTGLGLWICRSTVSEMGGEISLTSTLGEGTSAWVWLPALGHPDSPKPDTSDPPAASPDG
jgi:signal transduction histidine kinase